MRNIPILPENAPFTPEQRAWLNGYFAGLCALDSLETSTGSAPAPVGAALRQMPLLLLYGSQTGTAEGLARRIAKQAAEKGFKARALEMSAFAELNWDVETLLLLVTSTWGDGEPPDNAVAFHNFLTSPTAPRLERLRYAVLGLGDRNYSDFCGAAKKFDQRLAALGAKAVQECGQCDVDYEATATAWLQEFWNRAPRTDTALASPTIQLIETVEEVKVSAANTAPAWTRQNPFPTHLLRRRALNRDGSTKDTRHIEIALNDPALAYDPGDALGICPRNCPELVDELIATLGFRGDETVTSGSMEPISLREGLRDRWHIRQPAPELVQILAANHSSADLTALLDPVRKAELDAFLHGRELIDLAHRDHGMSAEQFVALLRPLQPRLYSISSSLKAHPGEVHLTVGVVRYETHGRLRKGACSTYLAERANGDLRVFLQKAHNFRLPQETGRDVIMVGPGTGIAPFRSFLEERQAVGARGRNWLFFGEQQRHCDFLYEEELSEYQKSVLTRLDTAFSRDQAEKIYVQQRMLEQAGELWSWLEGGAHFYVCGDAKRMARDVDAALREVMRRGSGGTPESAVEYVEEMKRTKRYQRDVY